MSDNYVYKAVIPKAVNKIQIVNHRPRTDSMTSTFAPQRYTLKYAMDQVTEAPGNTRIFVFKHPGDAHHFRLTSGRPITVLACEWGDDLLPLPIRAHVRTDGDNVPSFWKGYLHLLEYPHHATAADIIYDDIYSKMMRYLREHHSVLSMRSPAGTYAVDWVKPVKEHNFSSLEPDKKEALSNTAWWSDWYERSRRRNWYKSDEDAFLEYVREHRVS